MIRTTLLVNAIVFYVFLTTYITGRSERANRRCADCSKRVASTCGPRHDKVWMALLWVPTLAVILVGRLLSLVGRMFRPATRAVAHLVGIPFATVYRLGAGR